MDIRIIWQALVAELLTLLVEYDEELAVSTSVDEVTEATRKLESDPDGPAPDLLRPFPHFEDLADAVEKYLSAQDEPASFGEILKQLYETRYAISNLSDTDTKSDPQDANKLELVAKSDEVSFELEWADPSKARPSKILLDERGKTLQLKVTMNGWTKEDFDGYDIEDVTLTCESPDESIFIYVDSSALRFAKDDLVKTVDVTISTGIFAAIKRGLTQIDDPLKAKLKVGEYQPESSHFDNLKWAISGQVQKSFPLMAPMNPSMDDGWPSLPTPAPQNP